MTSACGPCAREVRRRNRGERSARAKKKTDEREGYKKVRGGLRVDRFAVGLYCVSVLDAREEINSIIKKRKHRNTRNFTLSACAKTARLMLF